MVTIIISNLSSLSHNSTQHMLSHCSLKLKKIGKENELAALLKLYITLCNRLEAKRFVLDIYQYYSIME